MEDNMVVDDSLLLYCLLMEAKRYVKREGDRAVEQIQQIADEEVNFITLEDKLEI